MSSKLIFGTFHFVRGEKRHAKSPSCLESRFYKLVKDFYYAGILATKDDFLELLTNGTGNFFKNPKRKVFFTFDDGYIEHFDFCSEVLEEFNSRGLFFPVVSSLKEGSVLDVNIIQLLCNNTKYTPIVKKWLNKEESLNNKLIRSSGHSPAIFDNPDIQYIKRNFQSTPALLEALENEIGLISQVKEENQEYFDDLYFNHNQAKDLFNRGHIIGGHGYKHQWLTELTPEILNFELMKSKELLNSIDKNNTNKKNFFCYPYGLTNDNVSCEALNYFDYCFTTNFGMLESNIIKDISRVDVNELENFL